MADLGTDADVKALFCEEEQCGRNVEKTKVKTTWRLEINGDEHIIQMYNSKLSGKKKILVDGALQHEQQVYLLSHFQYSWPIGQHLLSIVPNKKKTSFELRINGLPFKAFRKNARRLVEGQPVGERGKKPAMGQPINTNMYGRQQVQKRLIPEETNLEDNLTTRLQHSSSSEESDVWDNSRWGVEKYDDSSSSSSDDEQYAIFPYNDQSVAPPYNAGQAIAPYYDPASSSYYGQQGAYYQQPNAITPYQENTGTGYYQQNAVSVYHQPAAEGFRNIPASSAYQQPSAQNSSNSANEHAGFGYHQAAHPYYHQSHPSTYQHPSDSQQAPSLPPSEWYQPGHPSSFHQQQPAEGYQYQKQGAPPSTYHQAELGSYAQNHYAKSDMIALDDRPQQPDLYEPYQQYSYN